MISDVSGFPHWYKNNSLQRFEVAMQHAENGSEEEATVDVQFTDLPNALIACKVPEDLFNEGSLKRLIRFGCGREVAGSNFWKNAAQRHAEAANQTIRLGKPEMSLKVGLSRWIRGLNSDTLPFHVPNLWICVWLAFKAAE
uniref:Uncharacterized protein n=1 Tax=Larimichthys crocea TaxID=215358 RepID=A0A0F8APJ0_LARCR